MGIRKSLEQEDCREFIWRDFKEFSVVSGKVQSATARANQSNEKYILQIRKFLAQAFFCGNPNQTWWKKFRALFTEQQKVFFAELLLIFPLSLHEFSSKKICFQKVFIFHSTDGTTSIKSEAMPYNNLMGMDYQSLQQLASLVPTSQLLNPIDRLYSMQNQYFCNENTQNVHHAHHQMCE